MGSRSEIRSVNGKPELFINGKEISPLAYMTYITPEGRFGDFSEAGYRLFSFPVFFGSNYLNNDSKLPVFTKGIFDGNGADFSVFDSDVERILDSCPGAYIIPRVNVNPPRTYEQENPGECTDIGRISLASDAWAELAKSQLSQLIAHVENSSFTNNIVGYQLAGGQTEEWLPLEPCGISGTRAREKFGEYFPGKDPDLHKAEYFRFYSLLVADRICEFAGHVKELTGHRLIVGTFYGYTFECPHPHTGHHALKKLLCSDNIDFVCSPISYRNLREPGRDHPYMLPFASVRRHGKLYFSENDTRTHLSRAVNSMPHYNSPIWFGPERSVSKQIMLLHAAKDIVNGHGGWWFDMWGGWYADSEYTELAGRLLELYDLSRTLPGKSLASVAVFADEEVLCEAESSACADRVLSAVRDSLGLMGAPADLYLSSDHAAAEGYSAVISLVPKVSDNSERLAAFCRERGIPLLEIDRENAPLTPGGLRDFLRSAKAHVWCERDSVVYASESFVFLHTAETGTFPLIDPQNAILTDCLSGEPFDPTAVIPKGRSFLLRRIKKGS